MRFEQGDKAGDFTVSFDAQPSRRCGACQLCCKLLPVSTIHKPATQRCKHQKVGVGCMIYTRIPRDCAMWSCRWLVDPEAAGLARPDRSHLVVDLVPDAVIAQDDATGQTAKFAVLQVWCDPAFPHAHRAPGFRAYLAMMAERHHMAALVRYAPDDAITVFAPAMSSNGLWAERPGIMKHGLPNLLFDDRRPAEFFA